MKLVVAVIRPEKMDAVQAALDIPGACLMSISQVHSDRQDLDGTGMYRGAEFRLRRRPGLRLEVVAADWIVEDVVAAITDSAFTADSGDVRDAKIFVLPLHNGTEDECQRHGEEHFHEELLVGCTSN